MSTMIGDERVGPQERRALPQQLAVDAGADSRACPSTDRCRSTDRAGRGSGRRSRAAPRARSRLADADHELLERSVELARAACRGTRRIGMARLVLVLLDVRVPREEVQVAGLRDRAGGVTREQVPCRRCGRALRAGRAGSRAHAAERRRDDADVHVGDRRERRLRARPGTARPSRLQRIGERRRIGTRVIVSTHFGWTRPSRRSGTASARMRCLSRHRRRVVDHDEQVDLVDRRLRHDGLEGDLRRRLFSRDVAA